MSELKRSLPPSRAFLHAFLARRELSESNPNELRRPLYAFHPTSAEYEEAEAVLKAEAASWAGRADASAEELESLFSRLLCAVFVLWCAMFLSRSFEGGRWQWKVLEDRLGLAPKVRRYSKWAAVRSRIVREGARFWNLQGDVQTEGKKFYGFLMSQCGIPVRSMALKSGWASASKLVPVLNDLRRGNRPEEEIVRYVQENVERPMSISPEIFVNVMTKAALSLRLLPKSLTPSSPAAELDKAYRAVSDAFPAIEFSRESFDLLVESQERDAGEKEADLPVDVARLFAVQRRISWSPGSLEKPSLSLTVFLMHRSADASKEAFGRLFPAAAENEAFLSRAGSIFVGRMLVAAAEPWGGKVRLVYQNHSPLSGAEALGPAYAEFRSRWGKALSAKPLGREGGIDPLIPMLFEPSAGASGEWRFCGSGILRTSFAEALLLCPASAEISPAPKPEDILAADFVQVGSEALQLVRLTADAAVRLAGGEEYEESSGFWHIRLLRKSDAAAKIEFGNSPCHSTNEGLPVFRGFPVVYLNDRRCSTDRLKAAEGFVRWSPCLRGGRTGPAFEPAPRARSARAFGASPRLQEPKSACVCRAEIFRSGESVGMLTAVVLPRESAEIVNENRGEIRLCGWGAQQVQCLSGESRADAQVRLDIKAEEEADGMILRCRRLETMEEFELAEPFLAVFSPFIGARPFTLRFDYPRNCALFRLAGKPLRREAGFKDPEVPLRQARNLTAYVVGDPANSFRLTLSALRKSAGGADRRFAFRRSAAVHPDPQTHAVMLGFEDFGDELEMLLRAASRVQLTISSGPKPLCRAVVSDAAELWLEEEAEELVLGRRSGRLSSPHEESGSAISDGSAEAAEAAAESAPEDEAGEMPCVVAMAPLFPLPPSPSSEAEEEEEDCWHPTVIRCASRTGSRIGLAELEAQGLDRRVPWAAWLEEAAADGAPAESRLRAFAGKERPVVIAPRKALLDADNRMRLKAGAVSAFLLPPRLWGDGFMTDYDVEAAEDFVRSALLHPSNGCYWRDVLEQLGLLGRRGFAALPYWAALRKNVPLAFAFAAGIDLLAPPNEDQDDSSLLRIVGLSRGWRWDFMTVSVLEEALGLLADFIARSDPEEEAPGEDAAADSSRHPNDKTQPWVLAKLAELLSLDICRRQPILGQKILAALGPKLTDAASSGCREPYLHDLLCSAAQSPFSIVWSATSAEALNSRLIDLKTDIALRNPLTATVNENASVVQTAEQVLRGIQSAAAEHDREGRAFFEAAAKSLHVAAGGNAALAVLMRSTLAAAYAWARAYRKAFQTRSSDGGDADDASLTLMLSALAKKEIFFAVECLFDISEDWTAWCMAFGESAARSAPEPAAEKMPGV